MKHTQTSLSKPSPESKSPKSGESLYAHQIRFLEKKVKKSLLCWDTGTGKTRGSIEWANSLEELDVLVITPKALKENWLRNTKAFGLKKKTWLVVTKEEFRRDYEKLKKVGAIIVDEAHYFAGMKSQMSKNLGYYIRQHRVPAILLLTATPYMSTPWNIYTLARHLGYAWNYLRFKEKFFNDRYIGRRVVPEVKPGIEPDIAALVAKIGDIVKIDECADIPLQHFPPPEVFALTPEQEKMKKDIFEINPIVRFTKYHQVENGTLKGDEFNADKTVASYKNDRIYELCEENDKVIVVCRYNLQIDFLKEYLKDIGKKIMVIRGDVKDRDAVVQEAEKSSKAIMLIQASCSEGYELPSFPLMVFASLSFSYKDYKQMIGRILRLNKLKKNVYIHLVAKGMDTDVFNSIMNKQDFDVAIYAKKMVESGEQRVEDVDGDLREGLPDPF